MQNSHRSMNRLDFDHSFNLDHQQNLLKEAHKMMIEDKSRLEKIETYELFQPKNVEHKMSEEEAEFLKLEKFINPITGEKG